MNYNTLGCSTKENSSVSVRRGKGGRTYDPTGHAPTIAEFEKMMLWLIDKIASSTGFNKAIWQRNLSIVALIRYTGLRINSVLNITIADAKLALKRELLVIRPENMKNGTKDGVVNPRYEHRVELSPRAREALRLALLARTNLHPVENDGEMLFVGREYATTGKHITARLIQLVFKQVCENIDIATRVTPHKIRAFFATLAGSAEKVMSHVKVLAALQKLLHHSSIHTTMQHYAAAGREDLARFVKAVSADGDRLKRSLDEVFSGVT